jgi:TonB family protein
MRGRAFTFAVIICLGICLFYPNFVENADGQTLKRYVIHEITLRKKAIKTVAPKYPREAVKAAASGVAVSELSISEDGSVTSVKILESPHKSINASMIEALKQWKFAPFLLNGKPQPVNGKITYYFVIENNKGRVESPF